MRGIVLILATLGFLPLCLRYPAAGLLCWEWFSLMSPQQQVYTFVAGGQFNLMIAVATLAGWLLSAERKRWTPDVMPKLMLIFVLWTTLATCFAIAPDVSWEIWNRTVRSLTVVFLAFFLATTKARIHGLIWIVVISIGYYGVKGGLFTILTGGSFIVLGPPASMIGDSNNLALAIVMTVPLLQYLRIHTKSLALQSGLAAAMFFEIVAVLGTHSRGGAIALAVVIFAFLLSTRHKVLYGIAGAVFVLGALSLMPETYFTRLDSIGHAETDESFMGRVAAWQIAYYAAVDYFPFGGGFYAPFAGLFTAYFPDIAPRAAHSIYFQVLGEQGFVGLALYIAILVLALRNGGLVMRQARGRPEMLWIYDLASMIRLSLVGFYVGGAALSLAYYDGFLLLVALLSTLRELTARLLVSSSPAPTVPGSSAHRYSGTNAPLHLPLPL